MLKHIHVRNYALIEALDMDFFPGLNMITGETGAGKSILLGALGLVRGERADTSYIQSGKDQCVVEVTYSMAGRDMKAFFAENDLEYDEEVIVRRQVQASGKSRAFINDTPVNLTQLRAFSEGMIDIHSQHANLLLQDNLFQLNVVDAFAQSGTLLEEYGAAYRAWQLAVERLRELQRSHAKSKSEREVHEQQLRELREAQLTPGEEDELRQRFHELSHADQIKVHLATACSSLRSGDGEGAVQLLARVAASLERISDLVSWAAEPIARLEGLRLELSDIADDLEDRNERLDLDPQELETVSERISRLERLMRKYECASVDELIALRDKLIGELEGGQDYEFLLDQARSAERESREALDRVGLALRAHRQECGKALCELVAEQLVELGIQHARFALELEPLPEPAPHGLDQAQFLFSANVQGGLMPLSRTASGGELSRVMLSLKGILARAESLATIIFDEIDAGVSGAIAARMGSMLSDMGEHLQVINITHLPQIAAYGEHHYRVFKDHADRGTRTQIRLLEPEERVHEIAQMLSGAEVTEVALANARALLANQGK